jgi:16S rRNA (cytidine1402-2'-O)-methyltransferase
MGNLEDVTYRAIRVLQEVDLIAAEDTRQTRLLLDRYAIRTPMLAFHEHNETARMPALLDRLSSGQGLALVSDAGTPLISDPGFPLVREAIARGLKVVPIPGPCAAICALSAAGLATDRFLFVGFPPRQSGQRRRWLEALARESATLIFYESSHRILNTLEEMQQLFGANRQGVIARELTKIHETFLFGNIAELLLGVTEDSNQQRGEFVLLVQGCEPREEEQLNLDLDTLLRVLGEALPVKQAASLAASLTRYKKNDLYHRILKIRQGYGY